MPSILCYVPPSVGPSKLTIPQFFSPTPRTLRFQIITYYKVAKPLLNRQTLGSCLMTGGISFQLKFELQYI